MTVARAQILAAILGVGLWAACLLPPFELHARPSGTGEALGLWGIHVLPLCTLLLVPLAGRELTFLAIFPAALVLPIAGSTLFGWPVGKPTRPGDLALAALAFALYAIIVPIALRRARARNLDARRAPMTAKASPWARPLASLRMVAAAVVPLALAYAAHFDAGLRYALAESFGDAAGFAAAFVDLAALGAGVVAADLAFFGPVRSLRRAGSPGELAREVRAGFTSRRPSGHRALLALAILALFLLCFVGYVTSRAL